MARLSPARTLGVGPRAAHAYPRPRGANAPARRPLCQRFHLRADAVLADDPRPPGTGHTLHGDSYLDRAMVLALRRPLVACVGLSGPLRGSDWAAGVRQLSLLPLTSLPRHFVLGCIGGFTLEASASPLRLVPERRIAVPSTHGQTVGPLVNAARKAGLNWQKSTNSSKFHPT